MKSKCKKNEQENPMRCNKRDDLLKLSFLLKNLIFSEVYV